MDVIIVIIEEPTSYCCLGIFYTLLGMEPDEYDYDEEEDEEEL